MQLMTWTLGRLGSRFNLLFEPYKRRVMHSALGRFLDQPVDLAVGLVEPDGNERVLPFTQQGQLLHNCEQFERINSITYRGYSERYRLRFEFNLHAVFYPQNEPLCILPVFYLEMRLSPAGGVRWIKPEGPTPEKVRLFLRLDRPETTITASGKKNDRAGHARIDLAYRQSLTPQLNLPSMFRSAKGEERTVKVNERIVSLNPEALVEPGGQGLTLELPVTEIGSGIKWRLVWGAHVGDPVLKVGDKESPRKAWFRYNQHWSDIDQVMDEAIATRDDHLAYSRRFEKIIEQSPFSAAQRHLINQSFQSWLSNSWWCDTEDGADWFSLWEGSCYYHATLDVEYNVALVYLAIWPDLLARQLKQWPHGAKPHIPSAGSFLSHDMGQGAEVTGQRYPHEMEVEENCNYLLLLQAHAHWTGDLSTVRPQAELLQQLADYLVWADRDQSGYPSEGIANTIDDASPAVQFAKKQTYLAVKRLAALQAAADLLRRVGREDAARRYDDIVEHDTVKIEDQSWYGDHYVVCVDKSAAGVVDAWTGKPLPYDEIPGWDAYSIYTGNGLLLPTMVGQPLLLDHERLKTDLYNAWRETLSHYCCAHSSFEPENGWISQNLWRDHLGSYLGLNWCHMLASRYWDMQTMSNTGEQSYGFIDTYIANTLSFYPRGVTSLGYFLAQPRLVIDRLSPGGTRVSVEPDRSIPQRWPLLPLADWKAGKIPVCVVDSQGKVTIEGETDPVIIHGQETEADDSIG